MIVAIHQPNYLPWLGYFYKVAQADKFILLDDAQYSKNSYINRARIKTPQGERWLTIPVKTAGQFGQTIASMKTDMRQNWPEKHLKTLAANYRRAPYFEEVIALLNSTYLAVTDDTLLGELNIELIRSVCNYLDLRTELARATELGVTTLSTQRLVDISVALGGTQYLSGKGGLKYQDANLFAENGIALRYSDFEAAVYAQQWGEFVPGLSTIDALMNLGKNAVNLLSGVNA